MNFPDNLKYTNEHEWLKIDGHIGVVGITDHAQSELGDIVFIELPKKGTNVEKGKSIGTVEAVKAVSDIYSPVTGQIVEVNEALTGSPDLINKEPYTNGWMVKIEISNLEETKNLLDVVAYKALIGK